MLEIGYRAHDFGVFDTLDEFIDSVHQYKSEAFVHIAPAKTIRNLKSWRDWDEEYASSIKTKLSENNIEIKVLGCTINPVHPDKDKREEEVERYKKNIRLSKSFGAAIVGTETGSWSETISYSPVTFEPFVYDILLSSFDSMLNEAIKYDTIIGIEPAAFVHTICSPERLRDILERFNDRHFMVTMDPINLIPRSGIRERDGSYRAHPSTEAQRDYYMPLLDLKDRIAILHSKDFKLTEEGCKKGDLTALTGVFDWRGFMHEIRKRGFDVPIILENMNPETLIDTENRLRSYYV